MTWKLFCGQWMARLGVEALILLGVLISLGGYALAQEGGWSEPAMISTNTSSSWWSDVTVDPWGQPHVVWNSGRPSDSEEGQMDLLMYSTLQGAAWSEPNDIQLTAYGGYTVRPAAAADRAGNLHVTFRGRTTIYYVKAPISEAWNAGAWSSRQRISGAATNSAYYSDVAVDAEGRVHVVWSEGVSWAQNEYRLWFGTSEGAALYDGQGWRFNEPEAGLRSRAIYDSLEDSSGFQWFATDDGVYRFDGAFWRRFGAQDGLVSNEVQVIAEDSEGRFWFGTDTGVSVYDPSRRREQWISYTVGTVSPITDVNGIETGLSITDVITVGTGLPIASVNTIVSDPRGSVWVGMERGLLQYSDEAWKSVAAASGLTTVEVLALAVDGRGGIWVGTAQGAHRYDGKRWITYTVEDGLLSDEVTAIAVDVRAHVAWLGTDAGLSRFDGEQWTSYTASNGLPSGAITDLMVDREGQIWMVTEEGVGHYDGEAWLPFALPPELNGRSITALAEDRQVNAICPSCSDIFYRRSLDGGKTWSAPINLSNSFAGSVKPEARVARNGAVHVVWEEGEDWYTHKGYPVGSMYTRSADGGETWMDPMLFTSSLEPPQQITLGLARENMLIVVWRVPEADRFYYQLSSDDGLTWSEPDPVPGVIPPIWEAFSLHGYDTATDSAGNVHVLVSGYLDSTDEELGLIHLVWEGAEWSPPEVLYRSSDSPEWGRIDVGAGNQIYATWFTRDEAHIHDSAAGFYQVWASSYEADALAEVAPPVPTPTSASPPTLANDQMPALPTSAPASVAPPENSGVPSGLYTEGDEVIQLIIALTPIILVLVIVAVLRLSRSGHRWW